MSWAETVCANNATRPTASNIMARDVPLSARDVTIAATAVAIRRIFLGAAISSDKSQATESSPERKLVKKCHHLPTSTAFLAGLRDLAGSKSIANRELKRDLLNDGITSKSHSDLTCESR